MNRHHVITTVVSFALLASSSVRAHAAETTSSGFYFREHAFGMTSGELQYEQLLAESVFAGFPDVASLAFYEMPTSDPEQGVWMHPDVDGYLVVFARAKVNLWDWSNQGKIDPKEDISLAEKLERIKTKKLISYETRKLPVAIGERVEEAWHHAVFGITGGERRSGYDGVTLVFRAYSAQKGRQSWDAWSPQAGSLAARLRSLAIALGAYCHDGATRPVETALNDLTAAQSTFLR